MIRKINQNSRLRNIRTPPKKNGDGDIYQRGNRFYGRLRNGSNADGSPKIINFSGSTKTEVKQIISDYKKSSLVVNSRMTVERFLIYWMKTYNGNIAYLGAEFMGQFHGKHMILFAGTNTTEQDLKSIAGLSWSCVITSRTDDSFGDSFVVGERKPKESSRNWKLSIQFFCFFPKGVLTT